MEGYVYILQSQKNGSYYIGSTENITRRLEEHNSGRNTATRYLLPWNVVFSQKYASLIEARRIEYKLKKYKSKKIVEKIIHDQIIKGQ